MKKFVGLAAVLVGAWLAYYAPMRGTARNGPDRAAGTSVPAIPVRPPESNRHSEVGFRSSAHLHEHYRAHGGEFRGLSVAQYEAAAQALRDASAGGDVLEIVRPSDGVVSRFDRRTGSFLAFDADGTIRTFFKPHDGEAYFRRQAKRRPLP